MTSKKNSKAEKLATLDDDYFKLSFEPIEANFLATILQDCYYQLFNVGKAFEPKHLKLPELIKAETRGKTNNSILMKQRYHQRNMEDKKKQAFERKLLEKNKTECPKRSGEGGYMDESTEWVESLVESSGFLENMYKKVREKTQEVIDGQKNNQEGSVIFLESEGIRMKTIELSKIIADRENMLNQAASERVDCILADLKATIEATADELRTCGTFETLKNHNRMELKELEKGGKMVEEEMFYFHKCTKILETILLEKFHGWALMKEREIQVASLKDYLKEQKVLKSLEINYVKKFSEAKLDQAKKRNDRLIEKTKVKESFYKMEIESDQKCNKIMESYLNKEMEGLQHELQEWTLKYEAILEGRSLELRRLKEKRAKDMDWYATLKKRIVEYEQVIKDEMRMEKIEEEAKELVKKQHKNAIRIQAWWKGMQVRKCLGPYKKKKEKKGKKKKH